MSEQENPEKKEPVIRGYDKYGKPYYWPTEHWRQPKPQGRGMPKRPKNFDSEDKTDDSKEK
jgi:hypothetical protein